MNFKIDLEYEDISERNYVKTLFEMFDENDNSLYVESVSNNEYLFFSNRVIVDKNIFYNFTKSIKKMGSEGLSLYVVEPRQQGCLLKDTTG